MHNDCIIDLTKDNDDCFIISTTRIQRTSQTHRNIHRGAARSTNCKLKTLKISLYLSLYYLFVLKATLPINESIVILDDIQNVPPSSESPRPQPPVNRRSQSMQQTISQSAPSHIEPRASSLAVKQVAVASTIPKSSTKPTKTTTTPDDQSSTDAPKCPICLDTLDEVSLYYHLIISILYSGDVRIFSYLCNLI